MNRIASVVLFVLVIASGAGPSAAQSNPGFEKLKTLVGEWEGKTASGKPLQVSYQLVSGGTTLMETLRPAGEQAMVTMYTADGDRVALTHYCSKNNQPRMQTAAMTGSPQTLDFEFVGITNLSAPSAMHIHHLAVTFEGADHFTQRWTWLENGSEKSEAFHYVRKKSS